jgi:hypothetical protein
VVNSFFDTVPPISDAGGGIDGRIGLSGIGIGGIVR